MLSSPQAPNQPIIRISDVFVVIAATFLATTDALSTNTGAHATDRVSRDSPSQRLLRKHYTTAEDDDDSETRALNPETMKNMWEAGMTVDGYAASLKLTNEITAAASSAKLMSSLPKLVSSRCSCRISTMLLNEQ